MDTRRVRLDCPVTKSAFLPSNSTMCSRNSPNMAQNGPNGAQFVSTCPKIKNGPYLGLHGSKPNSEGTESTRNPPLFVVFNPRNGPTRRLHPSTHGHLVELEGSPGRAQWVPTVGPLGSTGPKRNDFSKVVPRPLGMLTQVFLARFEPVVTRFRQLKSRNALKMGRFGTKKGSKLGQSCVFPKVIVDQLGCTNK